MKDPLQPWVEIGMTLLSAVWLGVLVGVSFLATPIKFAAPTLDYPAALDVGRVTFALFSQVEWGFAAMLSVLVMLAMFPPWRAAMMILLIVALGIQGLWLLPELNARVGAVIAGETLPPSRHHLLYAGLEALKFLALLTFSVVSATALMRR